MVYYGTYGMVNTMVLFMWYNVVHGTTVKIPPLNTMVYRGTVLYHGTVSW